MCVWTWAWVTDLLANSSTGIWKWQTSLLTSSEQLGLCDPTGPVEFKLYCRVLAVICQPYSQDDRVDAFMHLYTASTPAPIFSKVPVLH